MNTKAKESRRIYALRDLLKTLGYYVVLSRASLGPFDLVAINRLGVILIQIKCNSWPDAAEAETLRAFDRHPPNTMKACWRFDDGGGNGELRFY